MKEENSILRSLRDNPASYSVESVGFVDRVQRFRGEMKW